MESVKSKADGAKTKKSVNVIFVWKNDTCCISFELHCVIMHCVIVKRLGLSAVRVRN